jgi:putative nucleotidyltransferase with HDIG domain
MPSTIVKQIEEYVKEVMKDVANHHSYSHVSRVRNRAVKIAQEEGFEDLEMVEIAALMHDIGLAYVEDRKFHGEKGAEIAGKYLRENKLLPEDKVVRVTLAIEHHSGRNIPGDPLLDILQDADCLEAFGAIGIMRACTSKADWPEYNPENIKGVMWGKCGEKYRGVFFPKPEEETITDEINMQIHYYDSLNTDTARCLAEPLVQYMKDFILQLEGEVLRRTA